jgi:hypothetical protein
MPSHLTTLGFPVTTEQDFRHYVYAATEFGQKIETPRGSYTLWQPGSGIELWVQTNLHKRIIGMNPHFDGSARMRVSLTRYVARPGQSILDGAFYGRANPDRSHAETGAYPFVFDLPNYDTYTNLELPCTVNVQLAAFAHHLQGYQTEADWQTGNETSLAAESLIPRGTFTLDRKPKDPAFAEVIMSARILDTSQLTNPVTGLKFYWAHVHTLGGEMDVVADPQIVQGKLVPGGIVSGTFWLSGKIV